MQNDSRTIVQTTAACDLGNHRSCRKVVLTLTQAGTVYCTCPCHNRVADLPDAWRELAVLTPPCDQDVILDDDELDELLELEGDRLLELDAESRLFGAWS
jgi:hypothetical protein